MPERAFQCTPAAWNRDPILNSVSWEAEFLFRRITLECDRYWRLPVDAQNMAHSVRCRTLETQRRFDAWTLPKVARCLNELLAAGIVRRLVQGERCWLEVAQWLQYAKGSGARDEPERSEQTELPLPPTLFALRDNPARIVGSDPPSHSNAETSRREKDKTSNRVLVPDGCKDYSPTSSDEPRHSRLSRRSFAKEDGEGGLRSTRGEAELLEALAGILPPTEMLKNGGMWRQRIRQNRRAVLFAIEDWKVRTPDQRRAIKSVAAWLTDRHSRALGELQQKTA